MEAKWAFERNTHKHSGICFQLRHNHFIEVHHGGILKSVHGSIQAIVQGGEQSLGSDLPLRNQVQLPREYGRDACKVKTNTNPQLIREPLRYEQLNLNASLLHPQLDRH